MNEYSEAAAQLSPPSKLSLEAEIREAINRHSAENDSNTPDFILAQHLLGVLNPLNMTIMRREKWYGRDTSLASSMPWKAGDPLNIAISRNKGTTT